MKCQFVTNVDVDTSTMSQQYLDLVEFRKTTVAGKEELVPYFPAGTVYDHPMAAIFCHAGSATPADEETMAAVGLTQEELTKRQKTYKRTAAGIIPADYALFDSGAITGYKPDGSYIEGPSWAKHAATIASLHAANKEEDI